MDNPVVAVEFRDGEKMVPGHVAVLMKGMATHEMTYTEAIRAANQALLKNRLNQSQRDLVTSHFKQFR